MRKILFVMLLAGCATGKIQRAPQSEDFSRAVVASLTAAGLPAPAIEVHSASKHLTVRWGKLNERDFAKIRDTFYFSRLPNRFLPIYDPAKEYELLDFLPPKMQATANKRVIEAIIQDIPSWFKAYLPDYLGTDRQEQVVLDTNCWGTVHDIYLSDRFPTETTYFDFERETPKYLTSAPTFERIDTAPQPYDILVYYDAPEGNRIGFFHMSIYLGHGISFEKQGLSEMDHFRLTFTEERSSPFTPREVFRPVSQVATPWELWGAEAVKLPVSTKLKAQLKDKAKQKYFRELVLMKRGDVGNSQNFFMHPLHIQLVKNEETGRYELPAGHPGSSFVPPFMGGGNGEDAPGGY